MGTFKNEPKLLETFKAVCNKVLQYVSRIIGDELTDKPYQDLATVLSVSYFTEREIFT